MEVKIKSLRVQNFRGIRAVDLPIDGQNIIIIGGNGTGKSSIVDALEYGFTRKVEKLEGRGDVKEKECIPNLRGSKPVFVSIKCTTHPDAVTISHPLRSVVIPPELTEYFDAATHYPFILRRSQLLKFLDAKPAERYDQLSGLIGLGELDAIEDAWKQQRNEAQTRREALAEQIANAIHQLQLLLGIDIEAEAQIVSVVNAKLTASQLPAVSQQSDLQNRQTLLREQCRSQADIQSAERLKAIKARIGRLKQDIRDLWDEEHRLIGLRTLYLSRLSASAEAIFETLLIEGKSLLEGGAIAQCPLCESPLRDAPALILRINERLNALKGLAESRSELNKQKNIVVQKLTVLEYSLNELGSDITANGLPNSSAFGSVASLTRSWRALFEEKDPAQWGSAQLEGWEQKVEIAQLRKIVPQVEQIIDQQIAQLMPTKAEREILDLIEWIARIDENWLAWKAHRREMAKAEYVCQQVQLVYDELLAAKARGLERIRRDIEKDLIALYNQLHPGEGYSAIALPLAKTKAGKTKAGSVELKAGFHSKTGVHPLGYYSEGHLDSLGLCIFLAFIKRSHSVCKLVVLDDVLTSVDAGHRLRFARLLAREFSDYQIVVTTHEEFWAQELTTVLRNVQHSPKVIRLRPWTLEDGVEWEEYIGADWEYFRKQARDGHRQDAIAGTGRNLEKFLFTMRRNLHVAAPATIDDQYHIGDLYEPFFKWLDDHRIQRLDMADLETRLGLLKQELDDYWRLRNWSGAHYNEWGKEVELAEALSFISIVQELASLFECPACSNLVVYDRKTKIVHCPYCAPTPGPGASWEFRPDWKKQTQRFLDHPDPARRHNAVRQAQSAFKMFLRDSRKRFGLQIKATVDDKYEIEHLYGPFFEWAKNHPRRELLDYDVRLRQHRTALEEFMTPSGTWQDPSQIDPTRFVSSVESIIGLFQCAACRGLLAWSADNGYVCLLCSSRTADVPQSAHWEVLTKR